MKNRITNSLKRKLHYVVCGLLILGFNSCGMLSRVREQGNAKSWVVTGKANNKSKLNEFSTFSEVEKSLPTGNIAEPQLSVKIFNKNRLCNSKFLNQNSNGKEFSKFKDKKLLNVSKCPNKLMSLPLNKLEDDSVCKSLESKNLQSKDSTKFSKKRSLIFGLLATLTFIGGLILISSIISSIGVLLFIIAIVFMLLSVIFLFIKPVPDVFGVIFSVLLTLLNIILAFIAWLAWWWS